ncbi:MAG TPA: hypothetical protein PLQ20_02080 [Candidatus Paceibacterota bacterium]|nr:hypothetical protein [Candidatus Paceibacterota bacterium]
MNFLKKMFYTLTAHYPRVLPSTEDEYKKMKHILNAYFEVPDDAKYWATIAGQITGTTPTKMRRTYKSLSNVAKRMDVNKLAQDHKLIAYEQLEAKLKAHIEEEQKKEQAKGVESEPIL